MKSKLQNIKAITQMLDGTHRTQTTNTIIFANNTQSQEQHREVGDIWKDNNNVEWEQRKGFKIQKGKLDELRNMLAANRMPAECPKCKQIMKTRLDVKFWKLEKHCFDCQVDFEHTLRIEKKFDQYEKDRVKQNAMAWLVEAEQEANELVEVFRNPLSFVNADGTTEKWAAEITGDEMANKIKNEFAEFKRNFLNEINTTK
jgi:ribosomal protein L37AE/L43A